MLCENSGPPIQATAVTKQGAHSQHHHKTLRRQEDCGLGNLGSQGCGETISKVVALQIPKTH